MAELMLRKPQQFAAIMVRAGDADCPMALAGAVGRAGLQERQGYVLHQNIRQSKQKFPLKFGNFPD